MDTFMMHQHPEEMIPPTPQQYCRVVMRDGSVWEDYSDTIVVQRVFDEFNKEGGIESISVFNNWTGRQLVKITK